MIRSLTLPVLFALSFSSQAFAGALYLEVGSPASHPEAQSMHALAIARVSACHEPGKSIVSAGVIDSAGALHRSPLRVVPLAEAGTFAILGDLPRGASVIDIAVTNPEYKNYQPHALVRANGSTVQWDGVKRFFGTPATPADLRAMLEKP